MPFQIVRNDITRMPVDAIVNAAKPTLLGGGGVDGAIHRAAGPELLEACRKLGGCRTGQAKITFGFRLPCRYVIHTVGPVWRGGLWGEKQKLRSCYLSALELADKYGCETVAFPLISAGTYGYPKDKAMEVASETIREFLSTHEMTVYLVVYGAESMLLSRKLFDRVQEYIDDHYVEQHPSQGNMCREDRDNRPSTLSLHESRPMMRPKASEDAMPVSSAMLVGTTMGLDRRLEELDESFQQMLLRLIDERGMTDAQCYKKANVDRKLFSKIRHDVNYKPSKPTAIAFAVALELDLPETESLLRKAGYALSRSSKFDVIIQYFIEQHVYNIYAINETLFYYDQSLLGAG